jgi:hypothetical protein
LLLFENGTATSLNPVGGFRFHEPWNETYIVLKLESNLESSGAKWAGKLSRGGVERVMQVESLNVLFGVKTI